jgi:PAS domain S-box-containing protein
MNRTKERIVQLEDEVRLLKAQLEQSQQGVENEVWQALKNMPDGTVYHSVRDLKDGILKFDYVSGNWEKIMGVTVEESTADMRNVFKHIVPDDLKMLLQRIEESLNPLANFSVEVRFIHPTTGKERWLQISSYPRYEGDRICAYGFIFDITARKEAEKELLAEKERLETLGNNLPNGVLFQIVLDTQTDQMQLSYVSGKWEELTGISSELSLYTIDIFFAMIHPDDLPHVIQEMDNSAQTMTNYHVEFRITVHGATRWVQMSAHPNSRNTLIVWDGIMLDITHRKEAGRELETEKMRLQALGDNLPGSALFQFSRDMRTGQMRMLYVSGTWETVTGVTAGDALTNMSNIFDMIDPEYLPVLIQSIEDSARTMTNYACETRFGDHWVQIIARPRREETLIVWDCIITNTTERKETECQMEAEKKRLQMLGDNLPNSTLVQFVRDSQSRQMRLLYVSGTWEAVTGINAEIAQADITKVFSTMPAEDFPSFLQSIEESARTMSDHKFKIRFGERYMALAGRPRREGTLVVWDAIITDITEQVK